MPPLREHYSFRQRPCHIAVLAKQKKQVIDFDDYKKKENLWPVMKGVKYLWVSAIRLRKSVITKPGSDWMNPDFADDR